MARRSDSQSLPEATNSNNLCSVVVLFVQIHSHIFTANTITFIGVTVPLLVYKQYYQSTVPFTYNTLNKTQCAAVHVGFTTTCMYIDIYQSHRAFSVSGTQWRRTRSAIIIYTHMQ